MGFLDKAMSKVQETTKAAQEKLDDVTAKRKADALLRDLGAWTYAAHKGGFPDAQANVDRLLGELAAHEAEHGPLGASAEPADAGAPTPPPPPTPMPTDAPASTEAPPAPTTAPTEAPPPPPPPAAPPSGEL